MTSNHSGIADADYSNDETHHAIIDSHVALCPQVWSSGGIQCQICYLTFSNVSEINHHYDTAHTKTTVRAKPGQGTHECEVCGKKSVDKQSLKRHLSTIHGVGDVKTFQCDLCSRVFKRKDHLERHLQNVHK